MGMGMGMWGSTAETLLGYVYRHRSGPLEIILKVFTGAAEREDAVSYPVSSPLDRRVRDDDPAESDGGLVLLAVEEPSIARMLTGVFKRAGVNVLWMGGLAQTLDWLRNRPLEATQIFVDCPSSGDDVVDFMRNAVALRPGLRIILAGGPQMRDAAETLSDCAAVAYVGKPYLPTELAWKLRSPNRGPDE
jgi:hypothetical protein